MNRNLLKWILIAAVILGAAAYLILSERPSNKERIVVGNSKAFKIEPVEGITISAPENALDKDREFKLSPVDDKTYDKVIEQLQGEDLKPLAVLELDAGLKPSDCLPGDYEVVFDLDGMGIPRRLQDKVVVYRGAGSDDELGFSKYNTRVSNGKLTYKSNQNSKLVLGLRHRPESGWTSTKAFWFRLPSSHVKYAMSTLGSGGNPLELLRGNWEEFKNTKWKTVHLYFALESSHSIFVQHESGDFRIFFRFIDTEDADRYHDWLDNDDAFEERLQELEKEANRIWEAKAKKIFDKEYKDHKEWDFWGWVYSKKRANEIKASINKEEIYDSLVMNDMKGNGVLAKLNADPKGKLPKSLEDVIDDIIRANQYLNDMGLHRLNSAIDVFLLNSSATGADGSAKNYNLYASSPGFLFLNYDNYFSKPEKFQLTCVHELCHMRQFYYGMPQNPQEATVVVVERDAARKWYGKYITNDPESRNTLNNIMTNRANHEMFGYPLDKPVFRDDGYTMGDALEGIRKGIGKEKENMTPFMISFPYYGPYTGFLAKGIRKIMGEDHADNTWTGWIKEAFQINDEQLNQGWNYFGATHLPLIYNSQSVRNSEKSTPKEIATFHISLKPDNPVAQLPQNRLHRDYAVNTFCIDLPPKPKDVMEEAANVYVCCEDKEPNPYVRFYWSDWEFNEYLESKHGDTYLLKAEPSLFYAGNRETDYVRDENGNIKIRLQDGKRRTNSKPGGYQLAVVTTSQSKGPRCNYYVVALFKPEAQNINKVDDDVITFRVPKPDKDLRKKGLVMGAEYTYTAKDGHTETLTVSPDQFGEKVNWHVANCGKSGNEFSISFHWFYKQDDNTICVSPESEKTMFNIGEKEEKKKKEKKEEPIVIDEKEGYWKQVSSNVKVVNTTDDTDPSDNSDATKDLRSLQVLREGDQELEFIGIATTEVKKDGEIHYEKDFYLDGYVNYTEPPKLWPANTNYTCEWYTDKDPFLLKMKKPFTFEVENTTSAPKACDKSKDKVTENKSKTTDAKWLNQVKTVFKTNKPKKDDPSGFTIEQKYTVSTFAGSNKKVSVVLTYNYEWVEGEEEPEPEVEEENNSQIQLIGIGGGGYLLRYHYNTHKQDHEGPLFSLYKDGDGYKLKGTRTRDSYENFCVEIRLDNKMIPVSGFYTVTVHPHYLSKQQNENYAGSFGDFKLTEKNRHEYGMQYIYYGKMTSYDADVFENDSYPPNYVKKHKTLTDLSNTDVRIELVLEK